MTEELPDSTEELVVEAVRKAAEKTNPALVRVLEVHLKETTGMGLDVAYRDADAFMESVKKLFGEYGARFFELAIIGEIRDTFGIATAADTLRDVVRELKGM
ncbi:MAG: DUF3227 domain-containing protein [Archaeoglobi archaeon]|nr:DUF3227 domain-containing protein [Archaeoglobi archaeon]